MKDSSRAFKALAALGVAVLLLGGVVLVLVATGEPASAGTSVHAAAGTGVTTSGRWAALLGAAIAVAGSSIGAAIAAPV